jgi:hypothetical protein
MEWHGPAPESSEVILKQALDMMEQLEQEVHELGSPDTMDQAAAYEEEGMPHAEFTPLLQLRPRTESEAPVIDDFKLSRPTLYLPEALEDLGDAEGSYAVDQKANSAETIALASRSAAEALHPAGSSSLTPEAMQEQQHAKFSVIRSESTDFLETHAYTAPSGYDASAACALDISYGRSGALLKGVTSRAATSGGQKQAEAQLAAAVNASPAGACTEGGSPIFSYHQLINRALSGDPTVTQSPTPATTQGGAPISVNKKSKDPSDGGNGSVAVQAAPRAVPHSSTGGASLASATAPLTAPAPALAAKKPKASNAALKQKQRNLFGQHSGKYPPSASTSGGGFSALVDGTDSQLGEEAQGRSSGRLGSSIGRGRALGDGGTDQQMAAGAMPYRPKYPFREGDILSNEEVLSSSMRTAKVSWVAELGGRLGPQLQAWYALPVS